MQGHRAHGRPYYRCRYPQEYAPSASFDHPLNVYLREDDVLPQIDEWLGELFSPERLDATIGLLLDGGHDAELEISRVRLEAEVRECETKIARYRALLEEGVDPSLVAGWLKEVTSTRRVTKLRLDEVRAQQQPHLWPTGRHSRPLSSSSGV
jgi:hypothetical protein